MKTIDDIYETNDLQVAAAILTVGFELAGINRENPRRVVFSFYDNGKIGSIVHSFWEYLLEVDACTYSENIKRLKNRIYGV